MSIVDSLLTFLKKNSANESSEPPEGLCPNCWGRQEYGNQFYEAVKNSNVDVNTKNPEVGWITDYANKHLMDIQLVDQGDGLVCKKCKISYRPK